MPFFTQSLRLTVIGADGRGVDASQDILQSRRPVHVCGSHGQGWRWQGVAQNVADVHGRIWGEVEIVMHLARSMISQTNEHVNREEHEKDLGGTTMVARSMHEHKPVTSW